MEKDFSTNPLNQIAYNLFSVRLIKQTPVISVDAGSDIEITLPVISANLNGTVSESSALIQWSAAISDYSIKETEISEYPNMLGY